ncbi:MAG TPA: glycosyltransferase [Solirubrobacteraceae bacterium]|nr:glycosyltransferase [Solirubrobacteraceae bacterium]
MGADSRISLVMPTFNRLAALRENFASVRAVAGIEEIIVVVDGSTDGTAEWLEGLADQRITVIRQPQRGSPAARNAGIDAAHGEWILMTEDDCFLPSEFAVTLLDVARSRQADIVSAPWVPVYGGGDINAAYERARDSAQADIHLDTSPKVFPREDLLTPFLNGVVLVRRGVFDALRYDESLPGNAWREETSLFLSAVSRGFRCVLTPRTASFQLGQWEGGQRGPVLAYELSAIRNNWRFLRAHADTLRRLGEIRSPLLAQSEFILDRIWERVGKPIRLRFTRLLSRLRGWA